MLDSHQTQSPRPPSPASRLLSEDLLPPTPIIDEAAFWCLLQDLQDAASFLGFRDNIPAAAEDDDGDFVYGLNPNKKTAISVLKPTDGAEVFLSNTVFDTNGDRITSVDDTDIIWVSRSTGTDDYFVGDEAGLTFVKIEAAVSPTTVAIKIAISQF